MNSGHVRGWLSHSVIQDIWASQLSWPCIRGLECHHKQWANDEWEWLAEEWRGRMFYLCWRRMARERTKCWCITESHGNITSAGLGAKSTGNIVFNKGEMDSLQLFHRPLPQNSPQRSICWHSYPRAPIIADTSTPLLICPRETMQGALKTTETHHP